MYKLMISLLIFYSIILSNLYSGSFNINNVMKEYSNIDLTNRQPLNLKMINEGEKISPFLFDYIKKAKTIDERYIAKQLLYVIGEIKGDNAENFLIEYLETLDPRKDGSWINATVGALAYGIGTKKSIKTVVNIFDNIKRSDNDNRKYDDVYDWFIYDMFRPYKTSSYTNIISVFLDILIEDDATLSERGRVFLYDRMQTCRRVSKPPKKEDVEKLKKIVSQVIINKLKKSNKEKKERLINKVLPKFKESNRRFIENKINNIKD